MASFYETEFEIWPGRAILVFTICFKVTVSLDYTTLTLLDLACLQPVNPGKDMFVFLQWMTTFRIPLWPIFISL